MLFKFGGYRRIQNTKAEKMRQIQSCEEAQRQSIRNWTSKINVQNQDRADQQKSGKET